MRTLTVLSLDVLEKTLSATVQLPTQMTPSILVGWQQSFLQLYTISSGNIKPAMNTTGATLLLALLLDLSWFGKVKQ